jgi:tetratricopeptide (TPR) repeat protein
MRKAAIFFMLIFAAHLFAQESYLPPVDNAVGDVAIAERYCAWAQRAIDQGNWSVALPALERAGDFASVSSDVSYLLALARLHEGQSKRAVLEAVRLGLATERFGFYSKDQCLLFEAELLIGLRGFEEALGVLETAAESADKARLALLALKGLSLADSQNVQEFRSAFDKAAATAMDAYPRDPRFVKILFEYLADKLPQGDEDSLIALAMHRLPVLLDSAPELAYLAVPFILDVGQARYLVAAYRAVNASAPASIPVALNLGLIDEKQAMDDLFKTSPIDKDLLLSVWGLLRTDASRDDFRRNLLAFSGVIVEDDDKDGIIETRVTYKAGKIVQYDNDADQDGIAEVIVAFESGVPVEAVVNNISLQWEKYPAVLYAVLGNTTYIPKPLDFFYKPFELRDFVGGSILYPAKNPGVVINERVLAASASRIKEQ